MSFLTPLLIGKIIDSFVGVFLFFVSIFYTVVSLFFDMLVIPAIGGSVAGIFIIVLIFYIWKFKRIGKPY